MKSQTSSQWSRVLGWPLVIAVLLLLPVALMLILPAGTPFTWIVVWFVLLAIFNLFVIWLLFRKRASNRMGIEPEPQLLQEQDFPPTIQQVMQINMAFQQGEAQVFRGDLKEPAQRAYEKLKETTAPNRIPLLQQDPNQSAAILIIPRIDAQAKPVRAWLHWLLFGLTFLTTTWAGALHQGVNLLSDPLRFSLGLPYSIGLLAILGFHELGHYFTALHYRMKVSPPYFIPVPFALGTFGAFISMRSPPEDRKSLFDVAVAGPLAGLALAIPALMIGLQTSTIVPEGAQTSSELVSAGGTIGSSILFTLVAKTALGAKIASGSLLELSPLAFAGWLGLLVTALNLLPIGQLDGGHIAQAMFGTRGGMLISKIAMWTLFLIALFFSQGLLFWALVVFFIARRSAPPLNDLTPVNSGRLWLGMFSFFLLATILVPMPELFWKLFA